MNKSLGILLKVFNDQKMCEKLLFQISENFHLMAVLQLNILTLNEKR